MPLPFARNNGKRQFQCFVCGILIPSFNDFKNHIKENHELGKEYVVCPLERCCAPVRDVRAHFKACHSHEVMPQNCQLKAIVWKDAKDPSKKKKKVSFKEGWHVSSKNRRKLHYNSGWELDVYRILDKMDEVIGYEVEPLDIEYFFDGERHKYLPDLRVHFNDGRREIWEIKPVNQTNLPVNEAKWEACNNYCQKRGLKFIVITEVWIARKKKELKVSD